MNRHFSSNGQTLTLKINQQPELNFKGEKVRESNKSAKTHLEVKNVMKEPWNNCASENDGVKKNDIQILWNTIEPKIVELITNKYIATVLIYL